MLKTKLKVKLIDIGVAQEEDIIYIRFQPVGSYISVYVTIVSGLNDTKSFIFQNNELVIVEGSNIHVSDVLKMKNLNMEEFL